MSAADTLARTADVLERSGWCQGSFVNEAGEMCMLGALRVACGCEPDARHGEYLRKGSGYDDAVREMYRRLPGETGTGFPLSRYNDEPGRTLGEVLAMLRGGGPPDGGVNR